MDAERTGKRGPHQADTPPRVGNYVTARVGNYVTDNPSNLGKYVTADTHDARAVPRWSSSPSLQSVWPMPQSAIENHREQPNPDSRGSRPVEFEGVPNGVHDHPFDVFRRGGPAEDSVGKDHARDQIKDRLGIGVWTG